MGTGALKTVTRKLHDTVEAIPDTGNLGSNYLDPLQSLESYFVHGLAVVRHLVNAARPVNRLPPEILAEIFSLVTESAALERIGGPKTWELDLAQIRRMHALPTVCRYWHDVALGTRSFWPVVWFAPKHRGEFIAREEPVYTHSPYPLTNDYSGPLSMYFSDTYPRKAKELLDKYATRTRELYLIMGVVPNTDDVSALLDTLGTVPGDALEHFAMKLSIEHVPLRELSLFSAGAPRLRSLGIHTQNLYPANSFPALTHLVVSDAPWTLDALLNLLARCPRLENAHLIWVPSTLVQTNLGQVLHPGRPPPPHPKPLRKVHLWHMRRFTLTLKAQVLATAIDAFLSRLVLPPSCHVYLAPHLQIGSVNAQVAAEFMRVVLKHWPSAPAASATATTPLPDNDNENENEYEAENGGIPRLRLDFDIDAELQLAHPHGPGSLTLRSRQARAAAVVHEMLRAPPPSPPAPPIPHTPFTSETAELWIRAQLRRADADLEHARALLRALPNLERLVVAGNPTAVLQALASPAPASSAAAVGPVLCPALDTLSVFVYSRGDAAAVRATLAARSRAGCPVRCLVVPSPLPGAKNSATEADMCALRALVEEVVVVGTEGWERVEVDWWTGRLREACRGNVELGRRLGCEWPTWEYLGWK